MKKIRVCVVGYGNVGREAVECIRQAPDMELAGVVRRAPRGSPADLPVAARVEDLGGVDAALLAVPSRLVPKMAPFCLQKGINTVDGYDIHGEAISLKKNWTPMPKNGRGVAVSSDPHRSIIRCCLLPLRLRQYTIWPRPDMGHTTVARASRGKGRRLDLPLGFGRHRDVAWSLSSADLEMITKESG